MMKTYYYLSDIPGNCVDKHIEMLEDIYTGMIDDYTRVKPVSDADFYAGSKILVNDIFDLVPCKTNDNYSEILDCYHKLLDCGAEVEFMKSPQCDSEYINKLLTALNESGWDKFEKLLMVSIENFIKFNEQEKMRRRMHYITARKNGNLPGNKKGDKLVTKKSIEMKAKIKELCKDFNGDMEDIRVREKLGIAKNTYFKYKREIKEEMGTK